MPPLGEDSTVGDFGQTVARDQELADQLVEEDGGLVAAERQSQEKAEGKATYDAGHHRPAG